MSDSCHGGGHAHHGAPAAPAALLDGAATVALVGNPNVGKSTLFNALTGARQRVGNWPGKTVQVATGAWRAVDEAISLVDLPGTYSLVPRSPDEELTRDLLDDPAQRPDLVVIIVDAANLARSLYLTAEVLETGVRSVIALTMGDVAKGRGIDVDRAALAAELGVPVVPVQPRRREGLAELAGAVQAQLAVERDPAPLRIPAPRDAADDAGDEDDDPELAAAEARYAWAHRVLAAARDHDGAGRLTLSDRVDRVLTSRWVGIPFFLAVMWLVFTATTTIAKPLQDALGDFVTGPVSTTVTGWLAAAHTPSWLVGLLVDGLINGVGQLLTFAPLMIIMFALLAVLEDSGYMARAAFIVDRLMRWLGLPGRAFLPIIVGFGCNVPALASLRILASPRQRMLLGMLIPYVTCSARLTVYVLLASIFFHSQAGTVIFAMYLLSVVLVIGIGMLLRGTLFRGLRGEALVLELPPYRLPTPRVILTQVWQKLAGFLRKASGIIVATVTVVWLLAAIPFGAAAGTGFGEPPMEQSLFGAVSRAVAPVFAPAGFDDWHAAAALGTGFVAKEAVVSTMAQTYSADEPESPDRAGKLGVSLRASFEASSGGHALAAALAFMVFLLAYTPCMATITAQWQQIGARMTLFAAALQLSVAWLLAVAVFQIGRMF